MTKEYNQNQFGFAGDARAPANRWGLCSDAAKEVEEQFADFHADL